MSVLRKLVPSPLLSAVLLVLWIAIGRSAGVAELLVGLGLAIVVPLITRGMRESAARPRKPLLAARFTLRVMLDVVVSNGEVGWAVLTGRWRQRRSGFVVVPLDLRDPTGLAVLAMVTTIVPGTVWSELAPDRGALLLHVWDVGDEAAFVARYKARYEQPILEIFG